MKSVARLVAQHHGVHGDLLADRAGAVFEGGRHGVDAISSWNEIDHVSAIGSGRPCALIGSGLSGSHVRLHLRHLRGLLHAQDLDLTGWLWTGLIERISQDRRSWTCGEDRRRAQSRSC